MATGAVAPARREFRVGGPRSHRTQRANRPNLTLEACRPMCITSIRSGSRGVPPGPQLAEDPDRRPMILRRTGFGWNSHHHDGALYGRHQGHLRHSPRPSPRDAQQRFVRSHLVDLRYRRLYGGLLQERPDGCPRSALRTVDAVLRILAHHPRAQGGRPAGAYGLVPPWSKAACTISNCGTGSPPRRKNRCTAAAGTAV